MTTDSVEDHALSVRVPDELYEQLRRFTFERRVKQAEVVREALRRYMEQEQHGPTT